jgi:hypothetical protein
MACPEIVELCFVAGDTLTIDWKYTENDGVTPIDLTGATVEMQLLNSITDLTAVKVMNGGLIDAEAGEGQFSLTNTETQALLPIGSEPASISFVSRVRITYSDSTTKTIAGVNVTIEQGGIR